MQTIHIKNIEKYHPQYRDRKLIWCKTYFTMLNSDPEFELLCEIDKWRFIALVMLELQLRKPIPLDSAYLLRKGFELKKRPISLTLKMLHDFIVIGEESPHELIKTDGGYIYFIEAKGINLIKIGYSEDPGRRINELQREIKQELNLLYTIPGTIQKENEFHSKFKHLEVSPEWYKKTLEIDNFIKELSQTLENIDVTEIGLKCNIDIELEEDIERDIELEKEAEEEKKESGKIPPSLPLIKDFFKNDTEAEKFFDYFQSNGWKVGGKAPMKDWQAAARNWIRRVKVQPVVVKPKDDYEDKVKKWKADAVPMPDDARKALKVIGL